ncbi:hypothetical protein, partial [Nocardia seriolae]
SKPSPPTANESTTHDTRLRIPSGNEADANSQRIPGCKLPSGGNEAMVDVGGVKPGTDYNVTETK